MGSKLHSLSIGHTLSIPSRLDIKRGFILTPRGKTLGTRLPGVLNLAQGVDVSRDCVRYLH